MLKTEFHSHLPHTFQENDGGIFFFLRIPNLDQKKGKLFNKQKSSFNNLRDSWHLICVERHFE